MKCNLCNKEFDYKAMTLDAFTIWTCKPCAARVTNGIKQMRGKL